MRILNLFKSKKKTDPTDELFDWRLYSVDLQSITKVKKGTYEIYWFENEHIGLEKTRFHRIYIPLEPFVSKLDFDDEPFETELTIEFLNLNLTNPYELDGLNITNNNYADLDASLYLGNAHNIFDINKFELSKISDGFYKVDAEINIRFDNEAVAKNERFAFQTEIKLNKTLHNTM